MIRYQCRVFTENLNGVNIYVRWRWLAIKSAIPSTGRIIGREITFLENDLTPAIKNCNGRYNTQSHTAHHEHIVGAITVWRECIWNKEIRSVTNHLYMYAVLRDAAAIIYCCQQIIGRYDRCGSGCKTVRTT